ncbi:MAG: hypothetical protein EAZ91_01385 [Cytophagales bacterium]|nr:MAG: hypothetical protein EAZ91_01385 [Cytophagales bacterium]
MKTLITFSVACLLSAAALSTPAVAQKKPSTEAYYEEQPRLSVAVFPAADPLKMWVVAEKEDRRAYVTVELLDSRNNRLHHETIDRQTACFRQRFDLSDMPDGRYTVRISDGNTVQERTFKLSSPGLEEQLPKRLVTMN